MYKTVFFAVALFSFALQGTLSEDPRPVNETSSTSSTTSTTTTTTQTPPVRNGPVNNTENPEISSSTPQPVPPKSGASNAKICTLLVQITSLAFVAKHVLLQ